jgi:hypothetical protein
MSRCCKVCVKNSGLIRKKKHPGAKSSAILGITG